MNPIVLLIGPDPTHPSVKGGVAVHMRYLQSLRNSKLVDANFSYYLSKLFSTKKFDFLSRILGTFSTVFEILFVQKRIDLVHLNVSFTSKGAFRNFLIVLPLLFRRIPFFIQVHGGRYNKIDNILPKKIWDFLIKQSVALGVFPGPQWEEFVNAGFRNKMICLPNMVPISDLDSENESNDDPAKYLFLGRIDRRKGIFKLIESFSEMKKKRKGDERLIIAGAGPDYKQVEEKISNLKCESHIDLKGYLRGDELEYVMNQANVFILPSSYEEGFPLSFLEAAERGMASIVTENSAIPYFFVEGEEYIKIKVNEKDTIVDEMLDMAKNQEKRNRIGWAARKKVAKSFSVETVTKFFEEIYLTLVKKKSDVNFSNLNKYYLNN